MTNTLILILCGVAAGAVNGFLGSGGGIIIILVLGALRKRSELNGAKGSAKDDFAAAIAAILPMSLISLARYRQSGSVDLGLVAALALPAAAGGLLGAFLLDRIRLGVLRKIFAALIAVSGVLMIIKV